MLDSAVDAPVAAPVDAGTLDAGTLDADNLDADAPVLLPNVVVLCGLPPRITVGHPETVPVPYTLENIGDADSAAVVLAVELFDELTSAWRRVHESTVAARVRVAEVRAGSVDIALPDFVISGTNRFRCAATTSDAAASSDVEGEFVIDVTPDLALQGLGLPTGTFTSETMVVFTVANVGAVATLQASLDLDAGNEFGGGWMTYRGNPDEGTASAIIGPLRAGETRIESTTGWCFYRLDDLEVRGRVLDRSRMDLVVEDNWRGVPHRVAFRPGPECFPE